MATGKNIYQRINEVRIAVGYVVKDASVQGYRAVTHDMVTAAVRQALIKNGIVTRQTLKSTEMLEVGTTKSGATQRMLDNIYQVDFINMDDPKDLMSIDVQAQAIDMADKASGKAASYAMKYAILKTFNLETGENEESRQEAIERKEQQTETARNKQIEAIKKLAEKTESDLAKILSFYKVDSIESMNQVQLADLTVSLDSKYKKQQGAASNENS